LRASKEVSVKEGLVEWPSKQHFENLKIESKSITASGKQRTIALLFE